MIGNLVNTIVILLINVYESSIYKKQYSIPKIIKVDFNRLSSISVG